jgi:hypothetical protein
LAILPKEGVSPDVGAELSKSPAFAGLAPTIAPIAAESAHFLYFPYKTIGGNCLKSFPNAYIPSAYEADFLDPGTEAPKWQSTDAARFAVPLPDQPFPIGVELRRSGVNYQAILHGRPLRGYTGLRFQTMINPTLCFESNGDVRLVSFGQLTVGSPQRGTLAPWTSPAFGIPEGTYRLWLIGRDGKTPQTIQASLGQVAFPNLRTAPPASGDAQPAAGCPLPIPPRSGGSG